jgi:hypothetical protein
LVFGIALSAEYSLHGCQGRLRTTSPSKIEEELIFGKSKIEIIKLSVCTRNLHGNNPFLPR